MNRPTTVLDYLYAPDMLSWEARFAEILHLRRYGTPAHEILPRLNITEQAMFAAVRRHNRPDVLEALRVKEPK